MTRATTICAVWRGRAATWPRLAAFWRSRTDAATSAGMDRQSLRDWVHRFNADGPAGLLDKPRSGRPARLSESQLQALDAIVDAGPDPETDGVVRWRCVNLQRIIAGKYNVNLCGRSVSRILIDRRFRHVSVRPQHPKSDPVVQDLFRKLRRHHEKPAAREGIRQTFGDLLSG